MGIRLVAEIAILIYFSLYFLNVICKTMVGQLNKIKIIISLFFLVMSLGANATVDCANNLILSCSEGLIKQYLTWNLKYDALKKFDANSIRKADPLLATSMAYGKLIYGYKYHDDEMIGEGRSDFVWLHENYEPALREQGGTILRYREPTPYLETGWWSGMDSFMLPMALNDLFFLTKEPKFKQWAEQTYKMAEKSPSEGGSVLRTKNSCWFSEYSNYKTTPENEYYVLNGHLFALQSIMYYALQSENNEALALARCGLDGFVEMAERFKIQNTNWARYMLNYADKRTTINQTHYVIFEKLQIESIVDQINYFPALNKLKKYLPFLLSESLFRENILAHNHPLYTIGGKLVMLKAGPPHPYEIDVYNISIDCNKNGLHFNEPTSLSRAIPSRFIEVESADSLEICDVSSNMYGIKQKIYSAKPKTYMNESEICCSKAFNSNEIMYQIYFDAELVKSGLVKIIPEKISDSNNPESYVNNQARIVLSGFAHSPKDVSVMRIILESEADSTAEFLLIDKKGNSYKRAINGIKKGLNILDLAMSGIEGVENFSGEIESVGLVIHTHDLSDSYNLKIQSLTFYSSNVAYLQAIRNDDALR